MTTLTPEEWEKTSLSHFQYHAYHNESVKLKSQPERFMLIADIDDIFDKCAQHAFRDYTRVNPNAGLMLFHNAHNHFRATARLALSGQCLPAHATGRACLESSVYGWYLVADPSAEKLWHQKPNKFDKQNPTHKKWKSTFQFNFIVPKLPHGHEELKKALSKLHQEAIDFGAHPNAHGLYPSMGFNVIEEVPYYTAHSLHAKGGVYAKTYIFLAEIGLNSLKVFNLTSPSISQELGLASIIERLEKDYALLEDALLLESSEVIDVQAWDIITKLDNP